MEPGGRLAPVRWKNWQAMQALALAEDGRRAV